MSQGRSRLAWRAALLALVLAQAGCYVIAGVGAAGAVVGGAAGAVVAGDRAAHATAVGQAVSITLDPPRDLALVGAAASDTAYLRGARSVVGRVTAERGDTLVVALAEVQGARGPASFPAVTGPMAAVVRAPGVRVHVVTGDARRSNTIFLGAAIGAAAFIAALFFYIASAGSLD